MYFWSWKNIWQKILVWKDRHITYFPGITTADDTRTDEALEAVGLNGKAEARQQYESGRRNGLRDQRKNGMPYKTECFAKKAPF